MKRRGLGKESRAWLQAARAQATACDTNGNTSGVTTGDADGDDIRFEVPFCVK